jgi:release factor glutamine methyltransferase
MRTTLTAATTALTATSETPRLDAELLMAHALGVSREVMILSHLDDPTPPEFASLLARRLMQEPVAYITGTRDFWTIRLHVGPGVLIPRPDSETLIEAAIAHFRERAPKTILDLGTGPGTLLLAALSEFPDAHGTGIDASDQALAYAKRNAEALGLAHRATFQSGHWAQGLDGQFDLILCNPPYVETSATLPRDVADYEPAAALFAGPEGLDDYRILGPQIVRLLSPGGCAVIEIGKDQAAAVSALFAAQNAQSHVKQDLAGLDRCIILTR